jgi:hypothetical protein
MLQTENHPCHDHQCDISECGCYRHICPKHRCELTSDGYNLVCFYCDWEPEEASEKGEQ